MTWLLRTVGTDSPQQALENRSCRSFVREIHFRRLDSPSARAADARRSTPNATAENVSLFRLILPRLCFERPRKNEFVGGGTTGSVIASRLTENPTAKVLVIEAGSAGSKLSCIPFLSPLLWWLTKFDYGYTSEPQEGSCLALQGGRCRWFRGRMLGGTSAINAALYVRGNRKDYDNWASMGNPGWSFDSVLPLFQRAEDFLVPSVSEEDAHYHGKGGNVPVSHSYVTDVLPAFIKAGESLGFPFNPDYNGASQMGFSRVQLAAKGGIRYNAARAYLTPARQRRNLHVLLDSPVARIVVDELTRTAKGVEYITADGSKRFVSARREVILSAGAVASPQILMLSGIGPKKELERHGVESGFEGTALNFGASMSVFEFNFLSKQIKCLVNLPVGENLQSHAGPGGLSFTLDRNWGNFIPHILLDVIPHALKYVFDGDGPLSSSTIEGFAFVNSSLASDPDWPDTQLLLSPFNIGTDGGLVFRSRIGLTDEAWSTYRGLKFRPGFEIHLHPTRPKSRGKILLRGRSIRDHPIIVANHFKEPEDVQIVIEAIRLVLRLAEQPSFKRLGAEFYSEPLPGCRHLEKFTKRYWECHMRQFTYLLWHDVGTCKMGPPTDPGAVVDPALRVYGVRQLRVADASIMPAIVSGNTMAACIMIGEKASDLIKMENQRNGLRMMGKIVQLVGVILSSIFPVNEVDNPVGFLNRQTRIDDSYDFVIVGGGTTGSVIANRLTENPRVKVLLIEAGSDGSLLSFIPAFASFMWWYTKFDYRYTSEPQKDSCLAIKEGRCRWFRGRMLGGSSALNGGIYARGNRKDYDNWAALGNPGWSFRDILPLFKRAENFLVEDVPKRDAPYHGTGGYFPVSHTYVTDVLPAFIKAGESLGFPHNKDYNGASQRGFSRVQVAANRGKRYSTATGYLRPVRNRRNLHILLNAPVSRIVIDETTKTAKGVEYLTKNGSRHFVSATREVILSAGVVASPQILMLSGIGPKKELKKHGIQPIVDLPVGENLQSHAGPGGLYFGFTRNSGLFVPELLTTEFIQHVQNFLKTGEGPLSSPTGFEGVAFVNTSHAADPDWPDIELLMGALTIATDGGNFYKRRIGLSDEAWETYSGLKLRAGFAVYPHPTRPKSRGKILLRSANVFDHPIIIGNYFKDPDDVKITIEAIRLVLRLGEHPEFKKLGAKFYSQSLPGCRHLKQFTDEYWECHIRQFTYLHWHDGGTCKMGPPNDPEAVVDPTLRYD
ncbi:unnamed protein product [Darwinula stevensoni]|uniref:Glucose-methanol-choline oxidoreductase N-terminal domain-containing protein n=1 Tax=Darwinula stevensoni TaxID=69355 RepID=A0A7R9ACW7_9CRUS|nr:unnamed protein product [Darwinula stevensoni]CAG0900718.1 unnamed protein product [Darwinula stevensoni]